MAEMTKNLFNIFCSDMRAHIDKLPSFDDRIRDIYEKRIKLYGFDSEYSEFIKLLEKYNTEQDYCAAFNELKTNIIDYIRNSEAFNHLNTCDMSVYAIPEKLRNVPEGDVYNVNDIGHKFLSIDIKKANFHSLVRYSLINGVNFFDKYDWDSFLKMFTDEPYYARLKDMREVVFGKCNCKRVTTYEKYLIASVYTFLEEKGLVGIDDVCRLCHDEIVFRADNLATVQQIKDMVKTISKEIIPVRAEYFVLGKIKGSSAYVKKEIDTNEISIKGLSKHEKPKVMRFLNGEAPNPDDLMFIYDGRLAAFIGEMSPLSLEYEIEKGEMYHENNIQTEGCCQRIWRFCVEHLYRMSTQMLLLLCTRRSS